MYKIYIGELPVYLVSNLQKIKKEDNTLVLDYQNKKEVLLQQIEKIEAKENTFEQLIIQSLDLERLKEDFFSYYKLRKAGGGVVFNENNEILAIQRRGYWDLPKGKKEKGETIDLTAQREVEEETGVKHLELGDFICETFHTYNNRKGKRRIKWSFWYKMYSTDKVLIPQAEEDIEQAVWISKEELLKKTPIYKNIVDILNLV